MENEITMTREVFLHGSFYNVTEKMELNYFIFLSISPLLNTSKFSYG